MHRRTLLQAAAAALLGRPQLLAPTLERARSEGQDEEVLSVARSRIEQNRKAAGVVVVQGASGQPLAGVPVRVEQSAHEFLFGGNLFRFGRIGDAGREEAYRARFAEVFNYATLGFYWASVERERGHPVYNRVDEAVAWCARQGIRCKGHPLAWDDPLSAPDWLPRDPVETESLSLARVRECVTRFRDGIQFWDVVNEPGSIPRDDNQMSAVIRYLGAREFTRRHLVAARAANPAAIIVMNDWQTERPYYEILESLLDPATPLFDAVGIQSHMHGGVWPLRQVWHVVDVYAALGFPVHFTEISAVSGSKEGRRWGPSTSFGEDAQAEYVARLYTALFGHPSVAAASWWDFSDDGAWLAAPAGWLRGNMSPKPVFDRLHDMIKNQWWTRVNGRTDARGEFAVRAFRGTHRIRVTPRSGRTVERTVPWASTSENRVVVTVI